jgi:hypothetical protein
MAREPTRFVRRLSRTNKHGGKSGIVGGTRGKTPIIGAVSRKGNVVTRVLEKVTKAAA